MSTMTSKPTIDGALVRRHIELLFSPADGAPGQVLVATIRNGKTTPSFFPPENIDAIVEHCVKAAEIVDVYVSGSLIDAKRARRRGDRARGKEEEVTAVCAFRFDLGVSKPGSAKRYPTQQEHLDALAKMPIPATMLVNSGSGGIHPWWVFEEPVVIEGPEHLATVKRLSEGWLGCYRRTIGSTHDVDGTAELVRVLRVAGTWHHKHHAPVALIGEPRAYCLVEDFEDFAAKANARTGVAKAETPPPSVGSNGHATRPDDVIFARACNSKNGDKFARLHAGDTSDYADKSTSEADMAYAGALAFWTQDAGQIARMMRQSGLYRPKFDRPDYLQRTIANVLADKTEFYDWSVEEGGNGAAAAGTTARFLPYTDSGLAERFARQHGENVRYCYPWKKWLAWDGQRWKIDDTGQVERLAKLTARSIIREAADCDDDNIRKALLKFARDAESASSRGAMLRLAHSEPPIPVLPKALDTDPWLLNCENGTVNLQTGELRPHQREDMLTKLAPVPFDPKAECPEFTRFLRRVFADNTALIDFMQRLVGYCLTGNVSEQILPILHGIGANGKSTLVDVLLATLGTDYAMQAGPDLLMVRRNEQHPTALADLHGKRLVVCCESEEGARLAESLAKQLTGGDHVRARRMREDNWEFEPTHKVFMVTNHKPEVRGTDYAIWRRIRLVPFGVIIPKPQQDKQLPEKLRAELPGILAWAVRGCLDWHRHGLGEPAEVLGATENYRAEQDLMGGFLRDCCLVGEGFRARGGNCSTPTANGPATKKPCNAGSAPHSANGGSRNTAIMGYGGKVWG